MKSKQKRKIGVGGFSASPRAREYIQNVLDTGRISYGPYCKRFEREFSAIHGCSHGVLSNSGTSSLHVALQALKMLRGWADGDEVIVPATTFVATANIVLHNNMKPVFVDVEPGTYGIDPKLIYRAINPRTRAIIPVHLFGMPCDMGGVMELARFHNLAVIEDSCETMFATLHGRPVGSFGDVACFSTYVAHLLVSGVGGIGITSDPELADLMRSLVNHGRDTNYISIDDDTPPGKRFYFTSPGHSFRITEFEGALACEQLETSKDSIAARRRNAEALTRTLSGYGLQLPEIRPGATHSFMMYPVLAPGEKWGLIAHLEGLGIETREMLPLIDQPIYREYVPGKGAFPVSRDIIRRGFYIGCHQHMTDDDIRYIGEAFQSYFEECAA